MKKTAKILSLILIFALCICMLAACAKQNDDGSKDAATNDPPADNTTPDDNAGTEDDANTDDDAASDPVKIGVVVQSLGNMYWNNIREALIAMAAEMDNVQVDVLGSANIEEQLKIMEDMITTEVDVIAVSAYDATAIVTGIDAAKDAGIPVFCIDNNCTATEITSFIGGDSVEGGYLCGQWIIEAMGGTGKMAILEGPGGNFNSNARIEGLNKALGEVENDIEIVASVTANYKRDQGLNVANDIITANPDLDLIFALNDEMALGAVEAINASGRDDIILIGYNGVPETVVAVYDGKMSATLEYDPNPLAKTFLDVAVDMVRNGTTPDAVYNTTLAVIDTEMVRGVIDDDMAATNDMEKVLYQTLKDFYALGTK